MNVDHVWAVVGFRSTDTPGTPNSILSAFVSGVENCNIPAHTSAKHNPSLDAYQLKPIMLYVKEEFAGMAVLSGVSIYRLKLTKIR